MNEEMAKVLKRFIKGLKSNLKILTPVVSQSNPGNQIGHSSNSRHQARACCKIES